jgi:hypothetical protein
MFRTGGEYMLYDPETVIKKNIIVFKPVSENMNDYTFIGDTTVKPVEPPPRFGVDDNISSLLDAEHYRIAQEQIDRQTYETGRELSHNELMYIYKNVYNQQYYESQAEQTWVSERRQKLERIAQANEGLDANSATDLDRANNMNMALEDYYTWINTFDVGFEIIPKPPKDEEEEEEEEKVVGYKGYLGSDGKPLTKAEMMRINDEQMRARGYRNLDDYYVDHPEARPPDNML